MTNYLLDTHIVIWFAQGNETLSVATRKIINHAASHFKLFLSCISLWEISMLESKKRIILEMPVLEWINQAVDLLNLTILPISSEIAVESTQLPDYFNGDPADRLIAATVRVEKLHLITHDSRFHDYSKKKYLSVVG